MHLIIGNPLIKQITSQNALFNKTHFSKSLQIIINCNYIYKINREKIGLGYDHFITLLMSKVHILERIKKPLKCISINEPSQHMPSRNVDVDMLSCFSFSGPSFNLVLWLYFSVECLFWHHISLSTHLPNKQIWLFSFCSMNATVKPPN